MITDLTGGPVKKKILIVEDNSDSLEIMSQFITKIGHHPIKAKNSEEAIAFAETEVPALIFMDIDLPDIDGVKTTAMLKKNPKTSHIPVVAVTAWISALWQEKAAQVGIATYLIKPISPQILKETIDGYMSSSLTRLWRRHLRIITSSERPSFRCNVPNPRGRSDCHRSSGGCFCRARHILGELESVILPRKKRRQSGTCGSDSIDSSSDARPAAFLESFPA